ncbi:hypothetical protein [Prodigiosinella confusarubida]|uniref:hypothetical protein n=1 Tax=Serratia sp. (strain ATCC 39006) TaxID=104623 RepID=UPI0003923088|nr:hypothetical protein [Serratia sp. ATCC 39006]
MKRISPERKTSVLAKLLPPYNMTVAAVVQREGILSLETKPKQRGNRCVGG